jgi:protease IV
MAEPRPGPIRRFFSALWWLIDGSRRLVLNLLFLALVAGALFLAFGGGPDAPDEKTTLVLSIAGQVVEQRHGSARERALREAQGQPSEQTVLRDVLTALDAAAKDPKIDRVLLVLDDFAGAGLPTLRELAAAVERFKASGKQVIAWGNAYDQRQYYLAAHADEVFLHPMGGVLIEGYGRLRNYYADAFDRLGVSANVVRVGQFKNALEPFSANAPSPETLESEGLVYDALWTSYTQGVERARKLPAGSVAQLIDELPQRMAAAGGDVARLVLDAGLVDRLLTRDELRELLIERGAKDDKGKSFRQIGLQAYLALHKPRTGGDALGVVVAEGEIGDGEAPPGAIGGRSTAELIRKAREDEDIKAVVLRVRSPGGSPLGSELVRRELELLRKAGKPVVVSMGDVAASGGYWIALAADEVIADEATITGSIGVVGMLPTAAGLMDKLSVRTGGHSTTWLATAYDPRRPLDPRIQALVQSAIDHLYRDFTSKVAAARKMTQETVDAVAGGRIWTGAQAVERGLVDRTGSFGDALQAAATRAGLDPGHAVRYIEREPGRLAQLMERFGGSAVAAGLLAELATLVGPAPSAMLPAALLQPLQRDLAWLAEITQQRAPYAAVVHCLCEPAW